MRQIEIAWEISSKTVFYIATILINPQTFTKVITWRHFRVVNMYEVSLYELSDLMARTYVLRNMSYNMLQEENCNISHTSNTSHCATSAMR